MARRPGRPGRPRRPAQRGFTLIESLIALVVFSVGVLGLVGMQVVSMQVTTDARLRTEAAAAADELLARMQSASRATVVAEFSTGGARYTEWLNTRLLAPGSGLPGAAATVRFGVVDADANTVRIEITWALPRERQRTLSGEAVAVTVPHQHVTVSALYD
jgi:type IV pilus assembly protein PilV